MSVPILDASAWRRYCGVPGDLGINQTTHLAQIADESGKIHDCYVKLLPNAPALLCEALGWILAGKAGLEVPSFAAVVMVPIEGLAKSHGLPEEYEKLKVCASWCSEVVAGRSVGARQIHRMTYHIQKKNCLRSKDIRRIAAFDQWSDLKDRNFGNVIRSAKGGYIPIDHETLLHDLLWVPTGITYQTRSLLDEANKALTSKEFKRFQLDMADAANGHANALTEAQADLVDIVAKLEPTVAATLLNLIQSTLASRCQPGWLANQLGVIV